MVVVDMICENGDFYEDDEPIEDIIAAWERAPKGLTGLNDTTPDVAGTTATCKTCGTVLGPMHGLPGSSIILQCGCGTVLEVWPTN
jgi:hypothetical protein